MKKVLVTLFFFIAYASLQAQAPVTAEQKADEAVAKLKNEIALTDEQIPKVKAITLDRINKVTAATKQCGKDKQKLSFANSKINSEWETQLKAIVTPEQFNKYLANKGMK